MFDALSKFAASPLRERHLISLYFHESLPFSSTFAISTIFKKIIKSTSHSLLYTRRLERTSTLFSGLAFYQPPTTNRSDDCRYQANLTWNANEAKVSEITINGFFSSFHDKRILSISCSNNNNGPLPIKTSNKQRLSIATTQHERRFIESTTVHLQAYARKEAKRGIDQTIQRSSERNFAVSSYQRQQGGSGRRRRRR